MTEAPSGPAGRDLVVDLLLPLHDVSVPSRATDARAELAFEQAVAELPVPSARVRGNAPFLAELDRVARSADRERMAWFYRAAPVALQAHIAVRYAGNLPLERARSWAEAGSHADLAPLLHALALWETSRQQPDDGWNATSLEATYASWAVEVLEDVAAARPEDPTPAVLAQLLTRPGIDSHDTVLAHARRWQALAPFHADATSWLLEDLMSPAFGSQDEVVDQLKAIVRHAPDGADALGLVPKVLARLHYAAVVEGDSVAAAAEFLRGHASLLRAAYERGPGHPAWGDPVGDGLYRNFFAYAFYFADAPAEAWREFAALDGVWTAQPWEWLGDPLAAYLEVRRDVFSDVWVGGL